MGGYASEHPDAYLTELFDAYADELVGIVQSKAADRHHPPMTDDEVIEALARAGARAFAEQVFECLRE